MTTAAERFAQAWAKGHPDGTPPPTDSETIANAQRTLARAERSRSVDASSVDDPGTYGNVMRRVAAARALATMDHRMAGYAVGFTAAPEYRDAWLSTLAGTAGDDERAVLAGGRVESRDLTVAGSAGLTIPQAFWAELTKAELQGSPVRSLAHVVETQGGAAMKWPLVDDTAQSASILSENSTVNEATDYTLTQASLGAFPYVAPAAILPGSLVQDAGIDILSVLSDLAGDRIARGQDNHFVNGTGSGQPLGIVPGTTVGVTSAANTALAYADIEATYFSIRPAYRASATWLMHSTTLQKVLAIADSSARPVYDREHGLLFGRPVVCDDNFPTFAASAKVIAFGDWSRAYVIRDVVPPISVILHERFADILASAVLVAQRTDGTVGDAAAARLLQVHA